MAHSLKLNNKLLTNHLLSEHIILGKKRIVIAKKFEFEILTYLCVFMSPEIIYATFTMLYVCVCMWVNTIEFKRCLWLSSSLVCILQIIVGRTLLILVNVESIDFFYKSTKNNSYTLRPMESKSLNNVLVSKGCIRLSSNLLRKL